MHGGGNKINLTLSGQCLTLQGASPSGSQEPQLMELRAPGLSSEAKPAADWVQNTKPQ